MSASYEQRQLRFESLQQAMQEAEKLSATGVRTSGNYSLGQILEHLARSMDMASGKVAAPRIPFLIGFLARLATKVLKKKFVYGRAKPGFKLPSSAQSAFWPTEAVSVDSGLEHLGEALKSYMATSSFPPHPFFGKLTNDEHHQLQCRHFELHLGFVHPTSS
jgi:hypothetical protein